MLIVPKRRVCVCVCVKGGLGLSLKTEAVPLRFLNEALP